MKPVIFSTIFSVGLAISTVALADTAFNQTGFDQDNPVYARDLAVWTGTDPGAIVLGQGNEAYTRDLALWYRYGLRG
jgi:hypothetical protein